MIYFDNAATTAVCKQAVEVASSALAGSWGNPGSFYSLGIEAEQLLTSSRRTIAHSLGVREDEIYFTASGTESNNLAVMGLATARANWGKRIVSTGYEHPSVENCLRALEEQGLEVVRIMPKNGVIDIKEIVSAVNSETGLVAAMAVNNETGALIDIPALSAAVRKANARTAIHCDFVQGYLKRKSPITPELSTLSISAHKVHGPKGIGALYVKKGTNIKKYLYGGMQERSLRPGTENAAYAAAFAAAVKAFTPPSPEVKETLLKGLSDIEGIVINSPAESDHSILNISLPGYKSETVLHFLEMRGIYVSSGSACSRGELSHTLIAMGVPRSVADGAIRLSFSGDNTAKEAEIFIKELRAATNSLAQK